jgi:20S proteasome subunit beta 1
MDYSTHLENNLNNNNEDAISCGTTIMAFRYRDGIVLAADSRTSSGIFVASKATNKLDEITENIICCRSGSAADTQLILRKIQCEIKKMSIIENTNPSVFKTAELASTIIYNNREMLSASLLIAGYDEDFKIFKVDSCGNIQKEGNIFLGGSGSRFLYGYCDNLYKSNMELSEALNFAKVCIKMAINRDVSSGGVVRIACITKDKIMRYFVPGEDILIKS